MNTVQPELCEGMYQQFSAIVQEMTDLCKECEMELEEFKKNLQEKVIPEKVCWFVFSLKDSLSKILSKENSS